MRVFKCMILTLVFMCVHQCVQVDGVKVELELKLDTVRPAYSVLNEFHHGSVKCVFSCVFAYVCFIIILLFTSTAPLTRLGQANIIYM